MITANGHTAIKQKENLLLQMPTVIFGMTGI